MDEEWIFLITAIIVSVVSSTIVLLIELRTRAQADDLGQRVAAAEAILSTISVERFAQLEAGLATVANLMADGDTDLGPISARVIELEKVVSILNHQVKGLEEWSKE